MTGGIPGFIRHGEECHPDHFLLGAETGDNIEFAKKVYWCPLDGRWYSTLRWLTRTLKRLGWENESYYIQFGKDHMPEIWLKNTTHPVIGDARNRNRCLQCKKLVKFDDTHWEYPAFCRFKCSAKWYADNTDRPRRARETNKRRKEADPTHNLIPSQVDYWIVKKGLSVEEAHQRVRERQATNSLEKFIKRAGGDVKEGTEKWRERQQRWLASLEKSGWFGNHSDVSKRLFSEIEKQSGFALQYGKKEVSARCGHRIFKLDCHLPGTQKAIEFFGDYWHANPSKYSEKDAIRRLDEGGFVTAREIWSRDQDRLDLLAHHGFDVLVIWEGDYINNPDVTIEKCVHFLNS